MCIRDRKGSADPRTGGGAAGTVEKGAPASVPAEIANEVRADEAAKRGDGVL